VGLAINTISYRIDREIQS
jgi:hypothetical protein